MSGVAKKLMSASGGAVESDEFFNNVSLLLHGDGTDGAQNNTFLDGSTNNFTIARNGNTTQGAFSPYGDRWSNYFDGTDSLAFTGATSGAGDFTTEAWVNLSALLNYNVILDNRASGGSTTGYALGVTETGAPYMYTSNAFRIVSSITITANTWNHVALVRSGTTVTLYVNGVSGGTYTSSANFSDTNNLIGVTPTFGYISDVRVVNGTAIYTSSFTPPTEPLTAVAGTSLLTCQSNRFKDNSVNNFTLTKSGDVEVTKFSPYLPTRPYNPSTHGGSAYFDGTEDGLTFTGATSGAGDFTTEAWVNLSVLRDYNVIFDNRATGESTTGYAFGVNAAGSLYLYSGIFPAFRILSSIAITVNTWNHVALVRSGTTFTLYVNGLSSGTYTSSANFSDTNSGIGIAPTYTTNPFFGYISDVRVVNGTAIYTSNFTPPTEPLTAVANTSLLCNFTNAAIFDSAAKNVLETVGNAQIDTTVVKYGTGSMEFDGNGDYLITPNKQELVLAGGPWTAECWVYPTPDYSNYRTVFAKRVSGGVTTSYQGYLRISTGVVGFYNGTNYESATALTSNQWSHCAWVYDGTNINIYVNGTSVLSSAATITEVDQPLVIGGPRGYSEWFGGYIDDLRITKGVARYTANFTPRSRAFPDQ
jgi:hypothetical protein